ncbi:uncharacterized protein KRP23_11365 [Phytophthora ramorum]|uniref:uncharacterized protein n=1 Tax=Phytophthora ramorum TaxID=164328 RepID=UPI0030B224A5|nr:hypothetical protein KRP23_11365 [Phytophthora ramorum]
MPSDTYYYKALEQQVVALSRRNELLVAELRTSKQQVIELQCTLDEHLAQAKTMAMQHQEESRALHKEMKALLNKVATVVATSNSFEQTPQKQDVAKQLDHYKEKLPEQSQSNKSCGFGTPKTANSWSAKETAATPAKVMKDVRKTEEVPAQTQQRRTRKRELTSPEEMTTMG